MEILIKKDIRMDMEHRYTWQDYNEAIEVARHHKNINGVIDLLNRINQDADAYEEKMKGFLESQREVENEKYCNFESAAHKYNMCVGIGVGIIIVRFLLFVAMLFGHLEKLYIIGHVITWVFIAVFLVFLIKAKVEEKKYRSYVSNIMGPINQINNEFKNKVSYFKEMEDRLYLDSLQGSDYNAEMDRRAQAKEREANAGERQANKQFRDKSLEHYKNVGESLNHVGQILNEWREERNRRY